MACVVTGENNDKLYTVSGTTQNRKQISKKLFFTLILAY